MNTGLLLGTASVVLLSSSLESSAAGGTPVPPASVLGGTALATIFLAALGGGAPQLANGLTGLVLLTALLRLPWGLLTGALEAAPTTPVPTNLR